MEQEASFADRMGQYAERLIGYKTGEMVSLMIHVGDELGPTMLCRARAS